VQGARVNNLKDISLEIPKRRLTVFTGVSGSGKSSLVFATIAAESQRLINETYSGFVQGFMPTQSRPDVDVLDGLTTAITVERGDGRTQTKKATYNRLGGMCPRCEGRGSVTDFDLSVLYDADKSLSEGALTIPGYSMDGW
jgi:excinuclease UvrABC ATPase subunit